MCRFCRDDNHHETGNSDCGCADCGFSNNTLIEIEEEEAAEEAERAATWWGCIQ